MYTHMHRSAPRLGGKTYGGALGVPPGCHLVLPGCSLVPPSSVLGPRYPQREFMVEIGVCSKSDSETELE